MVIVWFTLSGRCAFSDALPVHDGVVGVLFDQLEVQAIGGEPVVELIHGHDSLAKRQTWARERFPTWYMRRSGEKYDGPTGMQVMANLWAAYLALTEAEE